MIDSQYFNTKSVVKNYNEYKLNDIAIWWKEVQKKVPISRAKNLVDIGCGTGHFLINAPPRINGNILGIDKSLCMIDLSMKNDINKRVNWEIGDICSKSFEIDDVNYDCAIMRFLLHHLYDRKKAFENANKLLKKNGFLIIHHRIHNNFLNDKLVSIYEKLLDIHLNIYPDYNQVISELTESNFSTITTHMINYRTAGWSVPYYKKVQIHKIFDGGWSVLQLLNDTEKMTYKKLLINSIDDIFPQGHVYRNNDFCLFVAKK